MRKGQRIIRGVALVLLTAVALSLSAQDEIWEATPATYFEEALPIGNGRLGAMVYHRREALLLTLNDITLWTGEPLAADSSRTPKEHLPAICAALAREDYPAADSLVQRLQGKESEKYQPLGTLYLEILSPAPVDGTFRRALSLADAVATSSIEYTGTTITTTTFATHSDSCIAVHLVASTPHALSLKIHLLSSLPHLTTVTADTLIVTTGYAAYAANAFGITGEHKEQHFYDNTRGIHFCTAVTATTCDGEITCGEETLTITAATEVTLYLCGNTSFNGADKDPVLQGKEYEACTLTAARTLRTKAFSAVRTAHEDDYHRLYNRVHLSLGAETDNDNLPTSQRLKRNAKHADPSLAALYFNFSRYLLIAASRTEEVPMTLQGLWNEQLSPPWRSNYTTNINLEENYWAAEVANLSEMHMPLLTFLKRLQETGTRTARYTYGVDKGWCCGHNSDIWALTEPIGEGVADPQWANYNMAGAWLATHIFEHYLFTRDDAFLREYYPVLLAAAQFGREWLVEKDGELITPLSSSPENSYVTFDKYVGSTLYGSTADMALLRECLTDAYKAAQYLGVDSTLRDSLAATVAQLRGYKIGRRGQLLEWYHDWDDKDWHHRHQSHLFGLFPAQQITVDGTPALAHAAARSLHIKGSRTTGWSTAWRACLYARLHDAKNAYNMLQHLLTYTSPQQYDGPAARHEGGTYPNLFDAHPPFQIDGNFAGAAAIAEMLIQSTEDSITLLPACPKQWTEGQVQGLCTRTGVVVDFAWRNNQITSLTLHPRATTTTPLPLPLPFPLSFPAAAPLTLSLPLP